MECQFETSPEGEQAKLKLCQEDSFCVGLYSSTCKYVLTGLVFIQAVLTTAMGKDIFVTDVQ